MQEQNLTASSNEDEIWLVIDFHDWWNAYKLSSKFEPVQSRQELAVKRKRELQLSSSFDRFFDSRLLVVQHFALRLSLRSFCVLLMVWTMKDPKGDWRNEVQYATTSRVSRGLHEEDIAHGARRIW